MCWTEGAGVESQLRPPPTVRTLKVETGGSLLIKVNDRVDNGIGQDAPDDRTMLERLAPWGRSIRGLGS